MFVFLFLIDFSSLFVALCTNFLVAVCDILTVLIPTFLVV